MCKNTAAAPPAAGREPTMAAMYAKGALVNGIGASLLYALSLAIPEAVVLAVTLQLAVFLAHGLPNRSEEFYDISGSVTHFVVVAGSLVAHQRIRTPRQLLMALASTVWMTRLGTFLYLRISKDKKDERFDALKPCWLTFMGAWTLQALWVSLVQLPTVLINTIDDTAPLSWIDYVCGAAWVTAFIIEFRADVEKFSFRSDPANRHKFISTGLWSLCRQPNYFGEILMWVAMAAATSAAGVTLGDLRLQLAWLSPAFTATLLLKVSGVPMVEKAGWKKWGDDAAYQHYMKHTSMLIPWWPAPPLAASAAKDACAKTQMM